MRGHGHVDKLADLLLCREVEGEFFGQHFTRGGESIRANDEQLRSNGSRPQRGE